MRRLKLTELQSGIGLGIGERLIDLFLATRPLTHHLILLPTTRSPRKSRETVRHLREHLSKAARTSKALRSRAGPAYTPEDATSRVHILSPLLDLCDLVGVYATADRLVHGTVSNPSIDDAGKSPDPLTNVHVPRLDAVIFNAGYGGWHGINYPAAGRMLFRYGIVQSCTWPDFKLARVGCVVTPQPRPSDLVPPPPSPLSRGAIAYDTKDPLEEQPPAPVIGEVFCANVFGHYCFAHALLPLLSRTEGECREGGLSPGRIIWESSVEPAARHFQLDDLQGVRSVGPYESSKRLTDILSLTHELPLASRHAESFFHIADPVVANARTVRPRMYLTHPGVVASSLFPTAAFIFFWYKLALFITWLLGSPWHVVTSYIGATAPVWMAMASQEELDEKKAQMSKWGSACGLDRVGQSKKTEVEGWGWEGVVLDKAALKSDTEKGILKMVTGRNKLTVDTTKESREEFEAMGAECWKEMESLRREWESNLGISDG